jgi:tetratricopeptide (TPR) repeat protein
VPEDLVLELLLRRLHTIRPLLADEKALIPAVEAAYRLRYPDGTYRQILRGFLGDLYRSAGREEDRTALWAGDGFLRRWAVIGTFGIGGQSQLRRPFPPEREIDARATYPGRKGPVSWRVPPRPPASDQYVAPGRWIYPRDGVAYLLSQIKAPREMEAVLHLGSRFPMALWVNGRAVASEDPASDQPERRAVGLRLGEGFNSILLKMAIKGDTRFWARLAGPDGEPLKDVSLDEPILEKDGSGAERLLVHPLGKVPEPLWDGPFRSGAVSGWKKSLEELVKAGAPAPVEADARAGLALLLLHLGEEEQAVFQMERAVPLRPDDAVLSARSGEVLLGAYYLPRDHVRNRARLAFETALRLDPGLLPAYLPLARMLLEDNEPARAAEKLEEALKTRPAFLAARLQLLDLYQARGWDAEAEAALADIERIAPGSCIPSRFRMQWYGERGNAARALSEARAVLERDRGRVDVLDLAADFAESAGDGAAAEASLLLRRRMEPEDPAAAKTLAVFYEKREQFDRAIELAEEMARWNPADPDRAAYLGRLLEKAGRADPARSAYDRALSLEPGDIALSRYRQQMNGSRRDEFWAGHDEDLGGWLQRIPPADRFPRASAVAVLDITVTKFYPDGSSSEYTHQAFRLLSEEAKEELAHAPTPGELVMLRTVSADGRNFEPVPATGKVEYTMPNLTPGATVEWAYRVDRSRFDGWMVDGDSFYFQDYEYKKPFLLSRYVVLIPPGLQVDLEERAIESAKARSGGAPLARVEKKERRLPDGGLEVVYEARDAARLDREVGMPLREDYLPNVEILQKRTWDDVSSRFEDQVLTSTRTTPEIARAAAEAVAGREKDLEKVKAIYGYVNELVAESSGPDEAVRVLVTRSGDRTNLFKALLDAAGVANRWAFLRSAENLLAEDDGSHPRPGLFPERYLLVEPAGSPPLWTSLARRRSPLGKLPFHLQGGKALVLDPRGGCSITPLPHQPIEDAGALNRADITLSGEGLPPLAALASLELENRSVEACVQKERLRTVKDDLKRQIYSRGASQIFPGAKLLSGGLPGLDDPEAPFILRLELQAPRALMARGEEDLLFRPIIHPLELVKRYIQRPMREHPYRLGRELVLRDRSRISTGPRYRFHRIPQGASQSSRIGSYSLVYRVEGPDGKGGEVLVVERQVTLLPATVPLEEFPRILEFAKAIDRAEEERVVLREAAPASGSK